jgi:peptidoglycan/LPS O-acetylase OafA/YrhL
MSKIIAIQGLRGLAVAAVVLSHFSLTSELGYLGVDVFFVISGFVIARLLNRQFSEKTFSLPRFFINRFDRLFLPLAAVVSLGLVFGLIFSSASSFEQSWITALSALFGVSNIAIHIQTGDYFSQSAEANIFTHTWSLAVEEQFYVCFALAAWLLARKASKSQFLKLTTLIVAISIVSLGLFAFQEDFVGVPVAGAFFGYYSPITRAWQFGLGVVVFSLSRNVRLSGVCIRLARPLGGAAFFFLFAVLFVPFRVLENLPKSAIGILVSVLAGLVVLRSGFFESSPGPLGFKPLIWLGDRSYSLYLVHWPILSLTSSNAGFEPDPFMLLALCLGFGWLIHRFVERRTFPISSKGKRVAWTAAVPLVMSFAYGAVFPILNSADVKELKDRHASAPTCHTSGQWCLFGDPSEDFGKPVYLIGDSNAQMFWWGLSDAAASQGSALISQTSTSCPGFFGEDLLSLKLIPQNCRSYGSSILAFLEKSAPGTVVLGFSDSYYRWAQNAQLDATGEILDDLDMFSAKLIQWGHRVIIIRPIPNFEWSEDESWFSKKHNPVGYTFRSYPGPGPLAEGLRELSENKPFHLLDTHRLFCTKDMCRVSDQGRLLWRDSNHLSKFGSESIADTWRKVLSD